MSAGVTEKLLEIFEMVAPEGMLDDDDKADRLAIAEAIGQIKIGLYRLFERSEQRGHMPRWVRNNDGRMTLDLAGEATVAERAEADARVREMAAAGVAPSTPRWNPASTCTATGFSAAQAEYLFPTKERWDGYLKANGKVEVGGSDLRGQGGGISRPTRTPTTAERADAEDSAADLLKRAIALMSQGANVTPADLATPLTAARSGANGKQPHAEPESILREIEGQGGLDVEPSAVVEHIPMEQRPPSDDAEIQRQIWQLGFAKGKARGIAEPVG